VPARELVREPVLGQEPVPVSEWVPGPALVPAREQALGQVPVLALVRNQRQSVLILVPQPRLDLKLVFSFSPPKYFNHQTERLFLKLSPPLH
jgi:hypothetical protein